MDSPEETLKKKTKIIPPKPSYNGRELLIDPVIRPSRRRGHISLNYKVKRALKEDDCPLEITESSLLEKLAEDVALFNIKSIIRIVGLTNKEALTHLKEHDTIGDWIRFSYQEVKSDMAQRIKKLAELVNAFH